MTTFCQSILPHQEINAKTTGIILDLIKLFAFLNKKYKQNTKEKEQSKKRKIDDKRNDQSKWNRMNYNINNMQGSQYNYQRRSDQSTWSSFSHRSYYGRGFCG